MTDKETAKKALDEVDALSIIDNQTWEEFTHKAYKIYLMALTNISESK